MGEGGVLGLIFEIAADPSKAQEAMAGFKASTVADSTEISNIWSGAMDAITGPVGIAAGLFVGLGGGMFEAANKASEFGEQMLLASERTGISTETLSGLRIAAQMTDVSFDDFTRGLEMMSRNLSPFASSGSEATKALAALGLSATDSHGKLKPMDEILREVADKFKAMPDGTLKTADAMAIFGRSGASLIPILDEGSAGLDKFLAEAKATGLYMTREGAEASERYRQQMKLLKDEIDGLWLRIGSKLIPQMTEAVAGLNVWGAAWSGFGKELLDIGKIISDVAQRDIGGATFAFEDLVKQKGAIQDLFKGVANSVHEAANSTRLSCS